MNGGSLFEPPFETGRRPARRDHPRRRAGVPRARLRRRRDARDRRGRRVVARQPLSLLPRQGRTAVLLPGSVARPDAGGAGAREARSGAAGGAAARPRRRARALPARRSGRLEGAPRSGRAAAPPARAHRRQARSLRARHPRAGRRGDPAPRAARRRRDDRDAGVPRRAQLDGALVPSRRRTTGAGGRRRRRRLRRRRPLEQPPRVVQPQSLSGHPAVNPQQSARS